MPLETDVQELTKAVTALHGLIASQGGGAVPSAATAAAGAARGPGRPKKVTLDEVKAVAKKLMDEKGRPVAVKLIQEHGADQLANLDASKYSAFIAAAEVLLQQQPEAAEEQTGDEL